MASLYRESKSGRWCIAYQKAEGGRGFLRLPKGTTKRAASETFAAIQHSEFQVKKGIVDRDDLRFRQHGDAPLSEHIDAFEDYLEGKGNTAKHVDGTIAYVKAVLVEGCGFGTTADIDPAKVSSHLADKRRAGLGHRAIGARLGACKQFTRWLWRSSRTRADALASLERQAKATVRAYERRPLENDEARRMLEAAEEGEAVLKIDGKTRALAYRLALNTGLRASEIRSLTPESFNLGAQRPVVTVRSAYSKRRREDTLPLRADLAARLRDFLADRKPGERVFPLPEKTAQMLHADLAAARAAWLKESPTKKERKRRDNSNFLTKEDATGRVLDFHALRHTFITRLARAGVHPRTAQRLARHSSIELTMKVYTHISVYDEAQAVEALSDFAAPTQEETDAKAG